MGLQANRRWGESLYKSDNIQANGWAWCDSLHSVLIIIIYRPSMRVIQLLSVLTLNLQMRLNGPLCFNVVFYSLFTTSWWQQVSSCIILLEEIKGLWVYYLTLSTVYSCSSLTDSWMWLRLMCKPWGWTWYWHHIRMIHCTIKHDKHFLITCSE